MSSSVVAAAALLGGAFAQDPPMFNALCEGTGGGKFNPEKDMGKQTCFEMLEEFSWEDRTSFTQDECRMTIPDHGITVKDGLLYMQYGCCENGLPTGESPTGLCGDHFPAGAMCAEAGAFSPMEESGDWECEFNEPLSEAACEYRGKSGWVHMAECDVKVLFENVPTVMNKRAACEEMNGFFKTVRCWEVAMWVKKMVPGETIQEQCTQLNKNDQSSEVQDRRMMIQKFAMQCCLSTDSMLNNCDGEQPTYPPPIDPGPSVQPCFDMTKFDHGSKTSIMHCEGDEAIMKRENCLPGRRDDAWDDNEWEKCDVDRMAADDDVKKAACAELNGNWVGRECGTMLTWGMNPATYCSFEGFEALFTMIGTECCRADTTVNPITCPAVSPPPPPVGGGTCGQVSADAIRKARAKGYEPQRCAGNAGDGSGDPCADAEDVEACRFELVRDGGDPCAYESAEDYEQCRNDNNFGRGDGSGDPCADAEDYESCQLYGLPDGGGDPCADAEDYEGCQAEMGIDSTGHYDGEPYVPGDPTYGEVPSPSLEDPNYEWVEGMP